MSDYTDFSCNATCNRFWGLPKVCLNLKTMCVFTSFAVWFSH